MDRNILVFKDKLNFCMNVIFNSSEHTLINTNDKYLKNAQNSSYLFLFNRVYMYDVIPVCINVENIMSYCINIIKEFIK